MMSAKKEKIMFTVLRKISNDRSFISTAFKHWFANQDKLDFSADELVGFFESQVGFDANEKRNFRIAFYAVSSRSESTLLAVPELLLGGDSKSANNASNEEQQASNTEHLSPQEKTFQAFLDALLDQAKRIDSEVDTDLVEHFQDKKVLQQMKLSKTSLTQLNQWVTKDLSQPFNSESMTTKEMKAMFHQIYIALCETLGPVDADQVLNKSISTVEQSNTGYAVSSLI